MNKPDWIKPIEEREAKATKGPWGWHGNTDCQMIKLSTIHGGRIYVMDFTRWGMRDAQPRFQNDRGIMVKSSEMVKYAVLGNQRVDDSNRENLYRRDITGIDHPDAEFIAHSRQDVSRLLSALNKAYEALEGIAALELTAERVAYIEISDDADPIRQYEFGEEMGQHLQAEKARAALTAINQEGK